MVMSCVVSARDIPLVLHGGLIDPDSFMRLLRIDQGIKLGRLVNVVQRDDAGVPLVIEWSRLFDGVIVALAAPLVPWLGWHRAVLVAGVASGPLSVGLLGAGLAFAAAPLSGRSWLWAVPLIGMLLPGIRGFTAFGMIHYHIAQLALVAFTAGFALRAAAGAATPAWATGIAGGFSLWMMPETMPFVLLCFVALGDAWLFRPIGGAIARAGCGFLGVLIIALWLDPPHGGVAVVEIDRVSIVYAALGIAVCAAGGWLAWLDRCRFTARSRAALGIAGAMAAFGVWLACYPTVALGPYGVIPARDMRVFFGNMSETQPVHGVAAVALLLGPGSFALIYGLNRAWRARGLFVVAGAWLIFCTGLTLSLGLTARFVIFQQYPAGFAACLLPVALRDVSARWATRPQRAAFARVGMIALLLIVPYAPSFATAATAPIRKAGPPRCTLRHIAPLLRPAAGAVVLTPVEDVPELLYRTRIIAVGSLYQHGIGGYLHAWRAWRAPGNAAEPAAFVATRATYVLFCRGRQQNLLARNGRKSSLWSMLSTRRTPAWLVLVGHRRTSGFRLYRVVGRKPD